MTDTRIDEKALDAAWRAATAGTKIKQINIGMPLPDIDAAITAYLAAIEAAGVVMVPVEPTEAQRAAGDGAIDQYEARHLILAEDREAMAVASYTAMLAARPK